MKLAKLSQTTPPKNSEISFYIKMGNKLVTIPPKGWKWGGGGNKEPKEIASDKERQTKRSVQRIKQKLNLYLL